MIENIFLILTICCSVPAFPVFYSLREKQKVIEDMRCWKEKVLRMFYKPKEDSALDVTSKKMGGGFGVCHGNSTIVYARSIGENFLVHQNVTVGRGKMIDGNDLTDIGDNVYVGTGAIVIGGIHVGNNVKIGAGALANKNVPNDCTVVGNPMRIIHKKGMEDERTTN